MKLFAIILLALFLYGPCSKRRPQPIPPRPSPTVEPTPEPTATPTPLPSPSPVSTPTPAPTPSIRLSDYIPARPEGQIAEVSGEDLAAKLQAMQDHPDIASVKVSGGGSLTESVVLRKYTTFDSGTYACDQAPATTPAFLARLPKSEADHFRGMPISDYGCLLVADGVYVGGLWRFPKEILEIMRAKGDSVERAARAAAIPLGDGTVILEPSFSLDAGRPMVEVFQALGDVGRQHTGKAKNITIQGFIIRGRQQVYDGGVRSTVLLGNCERCAVMDVALEDTASIGITAGGSALEFRQPDGTVNKDNFARFIVFTRNLTSGVAGANIATINTEDSYTFENYVRRPGHHNPKFGGGVCGYDHETNSPADHTRNIFVYNNFYDYEDAHQEAAGTAICLQDPYVGLNRGRVLALNNDMVGGRLDNVHRYMSNGIFASGIKDFEFINNRIFRTGQNAMQIYNVQTGIIQDNVFDSTGGGGNPSFWSRGMRGTIVRRNNSVKRDIAINMQFGFIDICGTDNQYVDNFIPGVDGPAPATKTCDTLPTPTTPLSRIPLPPTPEWLKSHLSHGGF